MTPIKQFKAPDGAEIMGLGILGVFESLAKEQVDPILKTHNLSRDDIQPDGWYSLQLYYDLNKQMYDKPGGPMTLVAIGKATAANVTDPAAIGSVENFVTQELNRAATTVIRNTPEGYGYIIDKKGDGHYHVTNNTGSANDIVFGYIWESVRLLSNSGNFVVEPVANYEKGNMEGSTFSIQWE